MRNGRVLYVVYVVLPIGVHVVARFLLVVFHRYICPLPFALAKNLDLNLEYSCNIPDVDFLLCYDQNYLNYYQFYALNHKFC
ncbi:hypothetical protein HHI36_009620 [Cryptolaemus montrouzieri]|uniref:Secreted protein n=1 Tax=Cryptolaemus montrouzieri TaxID=559131 RepID=A0ABD2MGA8_9CUCU